MKNPEKRELGERGDGEWYAFVSSIIAAGDAPLSRQHAPNARRVAGGEFAPLRAKNRTLGAPGEIRTPGP